jgi:PKD repeat protein
VAAAGGPYAVALGQPITFVGSHSTDPQLETLTFAWKFGDGSTGSGAVVEHTYAQAGIYTVTLTVTDTSGLSSTTTAQASVAVAPVANAGGPYSGYILEPVTFNGSGSSDPQGGALTYRWNFGDNTSATGVSPVHTYTTVAGTTLPVTLTVTDSAGVSSTASTTVTLAFPPPTVAINGPYNGRSTLPLSFTSTVTDPADDDWTYVWNFGDGSTSNVANPTHAYAAPGVYTVSLYVIGQYNELTTVTSTATITTQGPGPALSGVVQSGIAPIAGAHVYLFAANTTRYGQPSLSLLSGTAGSDANGSYAVSASDGSFTLPGGYSCPTHSQLYVYAQGGIIGGNSNANAALISALGACGSLSPSGSVTVNEVTTIAAAFALSAYATDPTHVSSPNTASALTGIGNAFLNAANLASYATGTAVQTTAAGNGTAPQSKVNTLASILNGCLASGGDACTELFTNAVSGTTGTIPTDTATAAINIAQNQGANVAALYALLPGTPAFTPVLSAAPHDWAMGISYKGVDQTAGLAIDAAGDVWVLQYPTPYGTYPYLTELASNGDVLLSENTTCSAGGAVSPAAISIDPTGNLWLLTNSGLGYTYVDEDGNEDQGTYYVSQYCTVSNTGAMLSPPGGYSLGGSETSNLTLYGLANDSSGNVWIPSSTLLEGSLRGLIDNGGGYILGNAAMGLGVAIDGSGDFWVTNSSTNGIVELSNSGQVLSPPNGYTGAGLGDPGPIAIDSGEDVWVVNKTSLSKFSNTGQPLSPSGITNGALTAPYALAIDGAGNVWIANGYSELETEDNSVVELAPSGALRMYIAHQSSPSGYLDTPNSIAVDSAGAVWLSDGNTDTVTQFIGAATPVVTPLAANLAPPYSAPASKP